ncbi:MULTISPECIES: amidase [Paraburkholderia]|uniref:amidase n=1 Tax=Paraburkholderia TaxID=1822464 RepID=UPI000367318B|nr:MULTISPECIES: amidase [Paraburkholderia]MDH6153725.1 amidase [Paraburkholderia sp. WSM4179]
MKRDDLLQPGMNGAFVRDGFGALPRPVESRHATLSGFRLAVKDVFDVAQLRTGAGNPAWAEEQPRATTTAVAVRLILEHGAKWIGKTVTDELTYSLAGINVHYGTPRNAADADRVPGGSSSGSAVAVAAGYADIGLGTDCGGSIRLPASYCGIWGMRPTHGRIAVIGCLTLAQSFDTVGWFARDGALLAEVLSVLTHEAPQQPLAPTRLLVPDDVLPLLDPQAASAFSAAIETLGERLTIESIAAGWPLEQWASAFRVLQGAEIAQQHGAWAAAHIDSFGTDIAARMKSAMQITRDAVSTTQRTRVAATRQLAQAFAQPGTYFLLPTVPCVAPRVDAPADVVDATRARSVQMLCLAGLAGLPQVSMPWTAFNGAPLGLSIIGARGDDSGVAAIARAVHAMLG